MSDFTTIKGLQAMDAEQADLVSEIEKLRKYARSATDHEALDIIVDETQRIRRLIDFRKTKISRMAMAR